VLDPPERRGRTVVSRMRNVVAGSTTERRQHITETDRTSWNRAARLSGHVPRRRIHTGALRWLAIALLAERTNPPPTMTRL